jgi:hypothetical protein
MRRVSIGTAWVLASFWLAAGAGAAAEIAALDWMAGSWRGTRDGVASEEHWTTSAGGALVGMHKDVRDGELAGFEFLRVVAEPDGRICYLASPGGAPPTAFCAAEIGERRVVFENRQHDFPQRILYWLDGEGALHARVEGPAGGGETAQEWVWRRAGR